MAIDIDKMPARLRWVVQELQTIHGTAATSEESRRCAQRMLDAAECDYPALDAAERWLRADSSEPTCTVDGFADGGRTETICGGVAERICARCGTGRCADHLNGDHAIAFYRLVQDDGFEVVCEECLPDDAAGAEEID